MILGGNRWPVKADSSVKGGFWGFGIIDVFPVTGAMG